MSVNLTCSQVGALLSFYIDDKLNDQLKQFVNAHLEVCPTCRTKLETLRSMINGLRDVHERLKEISTDDVEVDEDGTQTAQYDAFKVNLSAYVDNELADEENIKVKKYIISNPKARKDLENLYSLKKLMYNSFDKSRNEVKDDFSKYILKRIDIQEEVYGQDSFAKVVALFIFILTVFSLTAVIIFWI